MILSEQSELVASAKFGELQNSLNLFIDHEGLVRVKGRVEHSDLPTDRTYHILLSNNHFCGCKYGSVII